MPHFLQGNYRFEVGKIICVERDDEDADPTVFSKPSSSIIHQGDDILHPGLGSELGFGVYLAMAIGKRVESSTSAKLSNLLGLGVLFDIYDVNELDSLKKEQQPWLLAKGKDTFCPISEFTPMKDAGDPYGQEVYLEINGEEVLTTTTRELEMGMEESLDHLSRFMTLAPGDIIAIRIKEGSGRIEKDDEIEAGISSIGILRNKVRAPSMTP
jgi:2-keto-4-pentenoate hydratase/2-oxohepta-3-ene-1,7-dioic acid hydratase in catechol pathway